MAKFTRAEIRAIIGEACTDEIENKLVALHLGVVDPLKDDLQKYKTEAEKIPGIQKQLDEASKGNEYKEKYETLKAQVDGAKAQADKEKAAREYFQSKGIKDERSLKSAMKTARPEIAELEIENGKIKDASSLDGLISDELSVFVSTTEVTGTRTPNPAGTGGGSNYGDIYKKDDKGRYVMSTAERQKAIAEKMANESE